MIDFKCIRCVTPKKCAVHGCCPGTWADETTPEVQVQVLPYMGKPVPNPKTKSVSDNYKPPFLTSRGTRRVLPIISKESDDYGR